MSVINTGRASAAALRTLRAIYGWGPMSSPQSFGVKSGIFSKVECNKSEWKVNLGIRNLSHSNRRWRKFGEDIPTGMEVIEVQTLNFKPNFKFSRLIFFEGGGPPSQLGCALGSLGQSLARVKISGRSTL